MIHEVVVYIHGVSPRGQKSHHEQYRALHEAIQAKCPGFPADYCGVEWGWHPAGVAATSHQLLSDAEENLGARALPAALAPSDFTVNPQRIAINKFRDLMIYNFSDMFYYVSEDGKN